MYYTKTYPIVCTRRFFKNILTHRCDSYIDSTLKINISSLVRDDFKT